MQENELRSMFNRNWVFVLYTQRRIPYLVIVFALPLLLLGIGWVGSLLIGENALFRSNILAYSGPVALAIALLAYGWFAQVFPQILIRLQPAFNLTDAEFKALIKKWADAIANNLIWFVIAGVFIGLVNFLDVTTRFSSPDLQWFGTSWVNSPNRLFYEVYYGFFAIVSGGVLLGSGLIGVIGNLVMLYDLLQKPLKLEYFRRMSEISRLSLGIGGWAMIAVIDTVFGSTLFLNTTDPMLNSVSYFQLFLASMALLAILLLPVWLARGTIIRAKDQRIAIFEDELHQLNLQIMQMWTGDTTTLQTRRDTIRQEIELTEKIPSWPISVFTTTQIAVAALSPVIGKVLDTLIPRIMGG